MTRVAGRRRRCGRVRTGRTTLPATPTVPPPAPTTTATIVSLPVAETITSSAALTCRVVADERAVVRMTTRTPTGTRRPRGRRWRSGRRCQLVELVAGGDEHRLRAVARRHVRRAGERRVDRRRADVALVSTVKMSIEPATSTAAVPRDPGATPTAATSSLLVARHRDAAEARGGAGA